MPVYSVSFEGNWNRGDEEVRASAMEKINALPDGALVNVTESHKSGIYSAYPGAERHDSYLCITVYWRE